MGIPSRIQGTLHVESLTCGSFTPPAGCIDDAAIEAGANIGPSKLENLRCCDVQLFSQLTLLSTANQILHTVRGTSGTVVGFEAVQYVVPQTTANIAYVDLQKAVAGVSTWTSVLSAPISMASSDPAYVPRAGTISSAGIADGNILRVVVTTTAAASTSNATGLSCHLTYSETYS